MMRRTLRALLLLYMVMLLVLFIWHPTDQIIMTANRTTIDPHGALREMIPQGERQIEAWVARSPGAQTREPLAFVLMFVGQGDRADRWVANNARAWGSKPVEVWSMNYPGSGGSSGPNYLKYMGPAALATYDRIKSVAGDRPIFVQGASLGTMPALCVAARRPVAGLTLHNPLPLRQLILGNSGWWNLWLLAAPVALQIPGDLDGVTNAAHINAPAIFLLSDHDEVIPPPYHALIVDAFAGPKRIITLKGALHNSAIDEAAQAEFGHDIDWLWANVAPTMTTATKNDVHYGNILVTH